jgi:hypothetical protein
VGICVTNLDASLIERSIAAAPGSVPLLHSVLCLVKKVRFFRQQCKSMSRFHISIGHSTVIATVVFFGAKQLAEEQQQQQQQEQDCLPTGDASNESMLHGYGDLNTAGACSAAKHRAAEKEKERGSSEEVDSVEKKLCCGVEVAGTKVCGAEPDKVLPIHAEDCSSREDFAGVEKAIGDESEVSKHSSLNAGAYHRNFPPAQFKFYSPPSDAMVGSGGINSHGNASRAKEDPNCFGYEYQDEMLSADGLGYGAEPVQWVLLQFHQPVYCPIGSLVIGSRLDVDTRDRGEGSGGGGGGAGGGVAAALAAASGASSGAHQCRLAFFGPVKAALAGEADLPKTGVYTWRTKECAVFKIDDVKKGGICYEAIVWKLVTGGGSVTPFLGMKLETVDKKIVGVVMSSYGTDGK